MFLVAVTGGIASGKSTVTRYFADRGAAVIDADHVARDVVEPGTAVLEDIVRQFGQTVLGPDGRLDRAALGSIVFSDAEKRERLNAITHPAVWRRSQELFARAAEENPAGVVVYDIPLLAEGQRASEFDCVVVVEADARTRTRRLLEIRGMTREQAESRIASQASDAQRRDIADIIIDSNSSIEATLQSAQEAWGRIVTLAALRSA